MNTYAASRAAPRQVDRDDRAARLVCERIQLTTRQGQAAHVRWKTVQLPDTIIQFPQPFTAASLHRRDAPLVDETGDLVVAPQ